MIIPSLPSVPPGDFPARRWDQLRRDAADSWHRHGPWRRLASAGPTLDLFGVRRRPALYPDWRPGPRAGARAFSILLSQVEARAYSATKPIGERTGLGLSISW